MRLPMLRSTQRSCSRNNGNLTRPKGDTARSLTPICAPTAGPLKAHPRSQGELEHSLSSFGRGALFLWPIAILTILYQARDTLGPGTASDFIPVWRAARAFLDRAEPYQVMGFVYPPSALLLFAPFGLLGFGLSHLVFHVLNISCIAAAALVSFRIFGVRVTSSMAPAITFALFISAPVRLTLYTENVNGIVLAGAMIAFLCAIEGYWASAGLALGLGFAIKPVLAPLVLLLVFARRRRALFTATAFPAVLSGCAFALLNGGVSYLRDVIPFLWNGNYPQNSPINTSLVGAATVLGLPNAFAIVARSLTLAVGALFIWVRLKIAGDERLVVAHVVGIMLTTTFLVFSFSWPYYAIYLLPTFMAVISPGIAAANWRYIVFGVAAYLIESQDYLATFGGVRVTIGYVVLLAALSPDCDPFRLEAASAGTATEPANPQSFGTK
jgi:arabinofuranan 3-O-arabinosyltransferase